MTTPVLIESSFIMSGLVPPLLEGTISAPTVREVGGPITPMIIRTDQDWQIDVDWEVHGSLLSKPTAASFPFTGEWILRAYLESIGPGTEYELPLSGKGVRLDVGKPVTTAGDKRTYSATISVLKNDVAPGVYKMVIALTHESSPGVPGPIAGFFESGMLQIYQP